MRSVFDAFVEPLFAPHLWLNPCLHSAAVRASCTRLTISWIKTYHMQSLRPFAAKMATADKQKVTGMEMAIVKMQADRTMSMMKMDADHKMAIAKMSRELEVFIVSKGAF